MNFLFKKFAAAPETTKIKETETRVNSAVTVNGHF